MSSNNRSPIFLAAATIIIIVFAIGISSVLQGHPDKPFSKIVTVGPIWPTPKWVCTSDSDFLVYGAIRGIHGALYSIDISGLGSQSLYVTDAGKMETFTVGAPGNQTITITADGTITGYLTLQTAKDATASCTSK
ncbi:MAG: hypothetical protein ACREAD_06340 [Nitrosopumilaceae archaeon]